MIPKFRYWDRHEQKMYDNSQIVIWNGNAYQHDYQKIFDRLIAGKKGLVGRSLHDDYLMKSTGLKDKNGVEIFENDILRYSDKESFWIETVEFDKDRAQFISKQQGFEATSLDYIYNSKFITTEIIGNIYEHKHLLEEE